LNQRAFFFKNRQAWKVIKIKNRKKPALKKEGIPKVGHKKNRNK